MQIIETTNDTGITSDIDFICSTDSTSYPTKDKIRNINRHYYVAVTDILSASGRMQYDDENLTTLPELVFDLVNNQSDYTNPADLLKIHAIEIQDASGNWHRLKEIDINDPVMMSSIQEFQDTAGLPQYYEASSSYFKLYPAPSSSQVTLSSGGVIFISRDVDIFTIADTSQEPGFAEPFHRILSLGASYDWLVVNGTAEKANSVLAQYEQKRREMRQFYSQRNREVHNSIRPAFNRNLME